uniref:Si:dkey-51a16.9 n=1 Tax=Cyprinodon variegatus TaxID=28743 RepID=A0A3Q2D737_CYPVA
MVNAAFWDHRCLCNSGLQNTASHCKMTTEKLFSLPLNIYLIILGTGLFILMLSLVFCCYFFRYRFTEESEFWWAGKKLSLLGQTCAVCLEEFRCREELGVCPCSHAFHKKCLLKWLEIRSVCPMCNKSVCRVQTEPQQTAEQPQSLSEV